MKKQKRKGGVKEDKRENAICRVDIGMNTEQMQFNPSFLQYM